MSVNAIQTTPSWPSLPVEEFLDHEFLVALSDCWQSARGERMIPCKHDFEGAVLECPQIVPHMTVVEKVPTDGMRLCFVGSDRVYQEGKDPTFQAFEQSFAPGVRSLMTKWAEAIVALPAASFWKTSTRLASGNLAHNYSLSLVLADSAGTPHYIVSVVAMDPIVYDETEHGVHFIGSGGISIMPIDIGRGTPDLPTRFG